MIFRRHKVFRTPEQEALEPLLQELRAVVADGRQTQIGYSQLLDRAERIVERAERAVSDGA